MKIRSLVALLWPAISFAVAAFAEEQEEVNPFPFRAIAASPQIVQQLEAINLKFDEAFNKHDTQPAPLLAPASFFQGRSHPKPERTAVAL